MSKDKKTTKDSKVTKRELLDKLDKLEGLNSDLDDLVADKDKLTDLEEVKSELGKLQTRLTANLSPDNSSESSSQDTEPISSAPDDNSDTPETPPEQTSETDYETDSETDINLEAVIADIDKEMIQSSGGELDLEQEIQRRESVKKRQRHIIFTLAGSQYAVSADNVQEVGEVLEITPVPNVPDWLLGVANLRGDIISMVNLHVFLGLEPSEYRQSNRMLVTQAGPDNMVIGLIVDQVSAIRFLEGDRISAPTAPIENQVTSYLSGVYEHEDHLLIVLDIEQLLLSSEMQQFQPA